MPSPNPYTPRILKLSAELDQLRNAPVEQMFSEEEIRKRLAEQQKAEQLAVLAKLSGNRELTAVGSALLPEALKMSSKRITEHGEFDPIKGDLRVFPEYDRRIRENRTAQDLARAEAAAAALEGREALLSQQQAFLGPYRDATRNLQGEQARLSEARRKLAERELNIGKPLKGKPYDNMRKAGEDLDNLEVITKSLSDAFNANTSRGVTWLGETQDVLARQVPGFVPDQWVKNNKAWADLQRLREMKKRYELFGATLTGNEKTSWASVTPPRGSDKEKLAEWINDQNILIKKAIEAEAKALAEGGYSKDQLETFTRGLYKAPKKEPILMYDPKTGDFIPVAE